MKQVFLSGQGQIELFDVPMPGRMAGSVLVRNAFSLISAGTEGAAVTKSDGITGLVEKVMASRDRLDQVWTMAKAQGVAKTLDAVRGKLADFTPIGYSSAGIVVEVSGEDTGFKPGQRVACMGGGFASHAEYAVVPKNLVAPVPDNVSFEEASFGALACIAMQGLRRLELSPGEHVGIIGLGLIGQIALRLAETMGYVAYGMDISEARAQHAREQTKATIFVGSGDMGTAIRQKTGGGLDGIVICASTDGDQLVNQAFELCRKRGRVSIVGDVGMNLERTKMYAKELELRLSCSYGIGRYDTAYELGGQDYPLPYVRWTEGRNLAYFIDRIARGKLDIRDLISKRIKVDEAKSAYALIKSGDAAIYGVLLDYDAPASPSADDTKRVCHYKVENVAPVKGKIRLGLIGVGGYAKNVHVPNIQEINSLNIRAVSSRSGASAAVVARKVKADYAASDYSKILTDNSIDAVVISTRHASHARIACDALEANKHVFVEKPMGITVDECVKICDLAKRKKKIVRVGFNRRFAPYLIAMKKAVGTSAPCIFHARVNVGSVDNHWSNTATEGGRLMGEGVHFFDLATWMLDSVPVAVNAQVAGDISPLNPNMAVQIRYENGSIANIVYTSLGDAKLGKEHFELFGNGRAASVDDYQRVEGIKAPAGGKNNKGQLDAMREFANALANKPSAITGADAEAGLWATAIALAAYESAATGQQIKLADFIAQSGAA